MTRLPSASSAALRVLMLPSLVAIAIWPALAAAQAAAPVSAPAVDPASTQAPESRVPEAHVEHLVTEDSQVRIEEERVRAQTRRIVVHSKIRGMGSYDIVPANVSALPGTDPAAGQRVWLNLDF